MIEADPELLLSVSHTTRHRREGETDGVHAVVNDRLDAVVAAVGEIIAAERAADTADVRRRPGRGWIRPRRLTLHARASRGPRCTSLNSL